MHCFRRSAGAFAAGLLALSAVGLMSPARAADAPQVTVGLGDVSMTKLPFIVAYDAGIYAKNGLDVIQFIDPNAAETIRASGVVVPDKFVRKGGGDGDAVNIGGGSPLMYSLINNPKAVDRVILATTDDVSRFHVLAQKDIKDPQQLKGKRIGYSGNGALSHFMAITFVRQMGWDPEKDVKLVPNSMSVSALEKGAVEAFVGNDIPLAMAIQAGYTDLVDLNKYQVPMAGSGVNIARAWLKDHKEAARLFVKSTVDAIALIKTNKQATFDAMAKWYAITDRGQQERIYTDVAKLPAKPYPAIPGIKKTMETFDSPGMRAHKAEDFYDDSFIKELDQSGYIDGLYKKS
jgi:NitT/TauT family transport system substrate-binding protein